MEVALDKKDVLILVKTYPEYSVKYTETVCTAGILADTKCLVRLYPIRYRYLDGDSQFSKYQWIKAKLIKAASDSRPESYNIDETSIELKEIIKPEKYWIEREKWVLNPNTLYDSVEKLYESQKDSGTSLGIVKLKKIINFDIESKTSDEIEQSLLKKESIINQLEIFDERKKLELLPIKFKLQFYCAASECKGHDMSILDWEFGELYRKMKDSLNWKTKIEDKISDICGHKRDTYLILGNMAKRQHIFCILGFFYPPKNRPISLF